jgi:serine/threonine protein kinase
MQGEVLDGRYRIVDVLGRGGIGIVYRAQQLHVHERDVAVKVLNTVASTRASTAQRFETEARIIARLRHPNTLKLLDSGRTHDGRLYIVTECLQGVSLSERLADGPISALETARIMRQVAEALTEAHEMGVIHRDLKPANIFLERVGSQEVVKVLDFGIAKLVDAVSRTAPTQIFGTPGFMAPEQCVGGSVDGRTDLYALGVIGYLCLSGQLPLDGVSVEQILAATVETDPLPLGALATLGPLEPLLEGLIMQLLAKDPNDRLPDAPAVVEACLRLERTLGGTDPVPVPGHSAVHREPPTPSGDVDRTELSAHPGRASMMAQRDTPPDPTLVLAPRSAAVDPLDVAPTMLPAALGATTVNTRVATEVSTQAVLRTRRHRLRRNLMLAVGSAVVAAALATLVIALFLER